jgi:hypothetical protein
VHLLASFYVTIKRSFNITQALITGDVAPLRLITYSFQIAAMLPVRTTASTFDKKKMDVTSSGKYRFPTVKILAQ